MLLHALQFSTRSKQKKLALSLGGQMVKTCIDLLTLKFDLDQSECKSSQVNPSHGQMEMQVDASWKLRSSCVSANDHERRFLQLHLYFKSKIIKIHIPFQKMKQFYRNKNLNPTDTMA